MKIHRFLYVMFFLLFIMGIKTLFHGFPDTERFFAEWMDERITLTAIMKFGTLNFAPTIIMHPPLYHYLTFIPIAIFFILGKLIGLFHDKVDFVRFYFNNTHYFFFIGRMMSYIFYWLSAIMIFKIARLFYDRLVSCVTVLSYLMIPRFIFDFSTTRPETLLFLNASIFFYFILKYYLNNEETRYLYFAAFFLGLGIGTKYNALYSGAIFIPFFIAHLRESIYQEKYKKLLILWIGASLLVFLGFFISDPFFIIQFKKYAHNLAALNTEGRYYWKDSAEAVFGSKHLKELVSNLYINLFGFIILLFGMWCLFKKDRKLFSYIFFTILICEFYFGIYLKAYSPLRYLNPVIPVTVLMFGAGVDFIIMRGKKTAWILIIFLAILSYNYFDIWQGLSLGKTHIQKARYFIEKNIPEFTNICIASYCYIPQLNMTEDSYYGLLKDRPLFRDIKGREISYKDLDSAERYDSVYKKLRIESLMKNPRYNLIMWDGSIETKERALDFLKRNNIKYIISNNELIADNKVLRETGAMSLVREFKPNNKRIYEAVFGNVSVFIYKVD